MKETIGFIGLGDIGAPMAERIAAAGFPLVVWNRTASKMAPLVAAGAHAASTPAELADQTDLVLTCLDGPAAMEKVLFGPEGLAGVPRRATLLVDCGTSSPTFATALAERLDDCIGMAMIDVPVSGGAIGAAAGTLAAMAGGRVENLERARPVIASFASQITHMGPVGSGQATKACNQIINFGTIAAVAEAINLGHRHGIDIARLPQAIANGFADSNILREHDRSVRAGDSSPVRILVEALLDQYAGTPRRELAGQLQILLKDMQIALDMGREVGAPLPLLCHFDGIFRALHHMKNVRDAD